MEKANSSREDSKWATLDRNILAIVFDKLDIMDITIGASRVCIYWFLVCHNKTFWNTIDLTKFENKGNNVLYKYRVDDEVEEALSFSNLLVKMSHFFYNFCEVKGMIKLRSLLIEITNLSRTAPKNLFFNFYSHIQKQDLMFVAERMPNIEKLALPVSWYYMGNSFRFAFSQWKNLKTLIMAHNHSFIWHWRFEFRAVGENCINLTNLKIMSFLDDYDAEQIVLYLQSLKRLSLQCSLVSLEGVLSLIRGLGNLAIINLTHCRDFCRNPFTIDNLVQAATQKLEKLIICSENDCKVCKDRPGIFGLHAFFEKNWRNEI